MFGALAPAPAGGGFAFGAAPGIYVLRTALDERACTLMLPVRPDRCVPLAQLQVVRLLSELPPQQGSERLEPPALSVCPAVHGQPVGCSARQPLHQLAACLEPPPPPQERSVLRCLLLRLP